MAVDIRLSGKATIRLESCPFPAIAYTELCRYWGAKGVFIKAPLLLILFIEQLLNLFPLSIRRNKILSQSLP